MSSRKGSNNKDSIEGNGSDTLAQEKRNHGFSSVGPNSSSNGQPLQLSSADEGSGGTSGNR